MELLLPEALMGVATVGVVYAAVRRCFCPAAGLIAGAVVALTPVAALMFRFNNPDALLVLLLSVGRTRAAAPRGRPARWLVLAGSLVGFGFLTKMLQAFLMLPAFALAYLLVGAAGGSGRGSCQLLAGGWPRWCRRRLVGGDRRAGAGVAPGRTSAARRTTRSSS